MSLLDKLSWVNGKERSLVERHLDDRERRLLRHARTIDLVDRVLGPAGSLLELYGSPLWQGVGIGIGIAELALLKMPFMYRYYRQTKDFDAFYFWVPKEVFATGVPFGGFIDIMHTYSSRTHTILERRVMQEKDDDYAASA
ncbi:hypothetical protein JXA12_00555 [Candidatus Woesearchaeota archaeon]|nr:hypothetical protein [Candidatus Woesearchaeota archaeon]